MKKTETHPAGDLGFLSRLYDGELSMAERSEFELHRRVCPECSAAAHEYEAVLALYRNAEPPVADPGLAARITRRIDRELRRPEAARFVPARTDIVWASVVIVALAGAIATYSLVKPRIPARETLVAEKKSAAYAPEAAAPAAAAPKTKARPSRREPAGERRLDAQPSKEAERGEKQETLADELQVKQTGSPAQPAPAPVAAMAAPRAMAKEKDREAGAVARDEFASEAPIRVGPGVTPPELVKKVDPRWPEALTRHWSSPGRLEFEAVVTETGDVRDVKPSKPVDARYERPVIDAIRQWKYRPAMKDGKPVAVTLTVTVTLDVR